MVAPCLARTAARSCSSFEAWVGCSGGGSFEDFAMLGSVSVTPGVGTAESPVWGDAIGASVLRALNVYDNRSDGARSPVGDSVTASYVGRAEDHRR